MLAKERRAVPGWRQACFAAGLIVLAVALSPPVDTLADQLLVAHMAEHLLIGDFAALLLVLGFTGPLLAPVLRNRWLGRLRVFTHPVVAFVGVGGQLLRLAPAGALSGGAAPRRAARARARHASWASGWRCGWRCSGPLPKPAWFTNGARLVYIVAVRLAGTVLANAMIFSGTVFYPIYRAGDAHWHISPMADQISAAGVMMVEESLLTIGLFCWLFLKVARENEERQAVAGLRRLAGRRARRAPRGASRRGGPWGRAVGARSLARRGTPGHGRRPGGRAAGYLTVSVPFMPAASWPSTEQ